MAQNLHQPVSRFTRAKAIERKSGIPKSGFDHKELGNFAVNASLNCAVKWRWDCAY